MQPKPQSGSSGLRIDEKFTWIASIADQPLDLTIFDTRSRTGFRRANICTWGDLGSHSDTSLCRIPNVGELTERGGGVASISEIIEEFVHKFGVRRRSVYAFLRSAAYVASGDQVRHMTQRRYRTRSVVNRPYAIKVENSWGQRFTVSDNNLRGYSFGLDRDIAASNGLQPGDSLRVPVLHANTVAGEASLIWRPTNLQRTVDIGRLSTVIGRLGLTSGDKVVIVATPESCRILRVGDTSG